MGEFRGKFRVNLWEQEVEGKKGLKVTTILQSDPGVLSLTAFRNFSL